MLLCSIMKIFYFVNKKLLIKKNMLVRKIAFHGMRKQWRSQRTEWVSSRKNRIKAVGCEGSIFGYFKNKLTAFGHVILLFLYSCPPQTFL